MLDPEPKNESVRFRMSASDRPSHRLVSVDVAKLDLAWQRTGEHYIALDGQGANFGRLERFASWLKENPGKPIVASSVYLTDERNWVWFHDGRHRFAVLRDLGYRTIKVAVRRGQAALFRKHFAPNPIGPSTKRKARTTDRITKDRIATK
ncbi:MAG TPA: hypothetical protein VFB28_04075 [Terriglobales bacterium]|nr:hypothetical protein [Terriglobales bacterium]